MTFIKTKAGMEWKGTRKEITENGKIRTIGSNWEVNGRNM